ncbi:MAG: ComEC/Rec2 family competence protein [Clostridia bacterium]|nr:ComEC/Rec2 family competence protein [Clostridia bacterium]
MFKHRTAAAFVCIFALGVVTAALASPPDTASFCTVFAVLFTAFFAVCLFLRGKAGKKYRIAAALAFAVAAFSFGALRTGISQAVDSGLSAYDGKSDIVTLKVESVSSYYGSCAVDGRITDSKLSVPNGTKIRVRVYEYSGEPVAAGDLVRVTAEYSGAPDTDLLSDGIKKEARGGMLAHVKGSGLFYTVRSAVSAECGEFFSGPEACAAAKAVTVGDRSELDSHVYSVYSNAGISHLLAISGLHISLVSSGLFLLLCAVGVNKRTGGIAGAVFALLYAALVGFTPSALRAALMMCALMAARVFKLRADSVTSLFSVLFILAIINPYTLFSVSTQLSFSCCLGVIFIGPYIEKFVYYIEEKRLSGGRLRSVSLKALQIVAAPAAVSFVASLASFPFTFLSFEKTSYLSPVANIVAIPAFSCAILLSLAAVAVGALVPPAGAALAAPAGWLFSAVTKAAEAIYASGAGSVTLCTPVMRIPLYFAVAALAVMLFVRKKRFPAVAASALCFVLAFAVCALINRTNVNNTAVTEYGAGNSEYIYFASEGTNFYIDLGGYRSCRLAVFTTGYSSLNGYFVTSADNRAAARFDEISGRMRVSKVFIPEADTAEANAVYEEIKLLAKARGCDIIVYDPSSGVDSYSGSTGMIIGAGGTPVTFDSAFFSARVFDGETAGSYFCDAALFTPGYVSGPDNLFCALVCAPEGNGTKQTNAEKVFFEDAIRITRKSGESELVTNDPGYS